MKPKNVLLLGLTGVVLDDARDHLDMPDLRPFTGTGTGDARSAFTQARTDHVIMGAGRRGGPGAHRLRRGARASQRDAPKPREGAFTAARSAGGVVSV